MSDFNMKLLSALFKGESLDEIMRVELESAFNELLRTELTVFLDYEKHDPIGYNTGNSRNGIYARKLKTRFVEISVEIPRDRNGEFKQRSTPSYQVRSDNLEAMVIQIFRKDITTSEIADLIEKMCCARYNPQTVTNMSKRVQEQVHRFHQRPLNPRYAVIYCDATCLVDRRDSVAKEAIHILLETPWKETKKFWIIAFIPRNQLKTIGKCFKMSEAAALKMSYSSSVTC